MDTKLLERKLLGLSPDHPEADIIGTIIPEHDNPIMDYKRYIIGSDEEPPNIVGGSLLIGVIIAKEIVMNITTGALEVRTESFFVGQEWDSGGTHMDVSDIEFEYDDSPPDDIEIPE